jgi:hypothetical protein
MRSNLSAILGLPDKGVGLVRDPNTKAFRQALMDHRIDEAKMNRGMRKYFQDPANSVAKTDKDRSALRGNLIKQLGDHRLSARVLEKGLKLIEYASAT